MSMSGMPEHVHEWYEQFGHACTFKILSDHVLIDKIKMSTALSEYY